MTDMLTEVPAPPAMASDYSLNLKKILVAVDLSPHSEKTAAYAAQLAAPFGASLTLLHVCSPNEATAEESSKFDDPFTTPEKELENLAKKIRKTYPECSAYVSVGDPADKVVMMAEILKADLILTGSHHPSFLGRLLGLDQPSRIVHRAPCPVLVYHASA
jgi:nucleotide-binding universal stress UspA family protein